jgi:signal transduction histidine kinase
MEAMPGGGTLKIRVITRLVDSEAVQSSNLNPDRELVIEVTDTGHGISASDLPKIFRTFFTTKHKKGMGLGLSICQSIIKAHGGKIVVESSPGQGTTFSICLPIERRGNRRNEPIRS